MHGVMLLQVAMMQEYLGKVVPPVLSSLVDQDARVRYYACEALYNIAKVARDDFMPHFPDTFDALFRLCADNDSAVHQATTFLDNLMKVSNCRVRVAMHRSASMAGADSTGCDSTTQQQDMQFGFNAEYVCSPTAA